ncbi:MAG: hypothetical protein ACI83D_000100 [Planctomycetota bacterium]|jgi:hypothetical protein
MDTKKSRASSKTLYRIIGLLLTTIQVYLLYLTYGIEYFNKYTTMDGNGMLLTVTLMLLLFSSWIWLIDTVLSWEWSFQASGKLIIFGLFSMFFTHILYIIESAKRAKKEHGHDLCRLEDSVSASLLRKLW